MPRFSVPSYMDSGTIKSTSQAEPWVTGLTKLSEVMFPSAESQLARAYKRAQIEHTNQQTADLESAAMAKRRMNEILTGGGFGPDMSPDLHAEYSGLGALMAKDPQQAMQLLPMAYGTRPAMPAAPAPMPEPSMAPDPLRMTVERPAMPAAPEESVVQTYGLPSENIVTGAPAPITAKDLMSNLVLAESNGNPNAVSPKGAVGLTQIMPYTGKDPGFGVTPLRDNSPEENLRFGEDYLNAMLKRYGNDPRLALAAYNWGPGNTDRWRNKGADPSALPLETRNYVVKVLGYDPWANPVRSDAQGQMPNYAAAGMQPADGTPMMAPGPMTQSDIPPGMDQAVSRDREYQYQLPQSGQQAQPMSQPPVGNGMSPAGMPYQDVTDPWLERALYATGMHDAKQTFYGMREGQTADYRQAMDQEVAKAQAEAQAAGISGGGPFKGTSMDAQLQNIVFRVRNKLANGIDPTPEEKMLYDQALDIMAQPKEHFYTDPSTNSLMQTWVRPELPASLPPRFGGGGGMAPAQAPAAAPGMAPGQAPAPGAPDIMSSEGVPKGEGRVIAPGGYKPLTEAQSRDRAFAVRMTQGNEALSQIDDIGYLDFYASMPAENMIGHFAKAVYKSDKARQFSNAAQLFLTAVLRKDSGAAVPITEYPAYWEQYIPAPGDDATTLEQKALARQVAMDALRANPAATPDEILAYSKQQVAGQKKPAAATGQDPQVEALLKKYTGGK